MEVQDEEKTVGHEIDSVKNVHNGTSVVAPQKTSEEPAEEEWSSDYSNDEAQAGPSPSTPQSSDPDMRKRAKTKAMSPRTGIFGSIRKARRNSLKRTHLQTLTDRPSDDDDRGRSSGPGEPSTSSFSHHHPSATYHHKRGSSSSKYSLGEGYPRNQRIKSIRVLSMARDQSPSRSVRFMDEDGSRPGSAPRSLAVSQVDVTLKGEDESESPRSRAISVSGEGSGGDSAIGKNGNGGGAGGNNVRS